MTKLTVNRELFLKGMKRLKGIIDKKPVQSVLENILCRASGNKLQMVATDLDITLIIDMELPENVDEVTFLLPYEESFKFLELLQWETITFEIKKTSITISAFTDSMEMSKIDKVEAFPVTPELPEADGIPFPEPCVQSMHLALETVSSDDTIPWMTMLLIDLLGDKMAIVSTTGAAIYRKTFELANPVTEQLLLRTKVVKALQGAPDTKLVWNENHIGFKSENTTLICKRTVTQFGKYAQVIPDFGHNITLKRTELLAAMKKVAIVSPTAGCKITLKSSPGKIALEAMDGGKNKKAKSEISGQYTGEVDAITLNPHTVIGTLEQVDSDEIGLAIVAPTKAVLFLSPTDASFTGLVMPMADVSKS